MDEIQGTSQGNKEGIQIDFERLHIPQLVTLKAYNHEYYLAGRDNRWFQDLLKIYNECSIHSAIVNNLHLKIMRLQPSGTTDMNDDLYNKCLLDYLIYGGFGVEIIWSLNHQNIVKANHLDFSKIRAGMICKETGDIEEYLFSNDWFKYNNKCITHLENFDPDPNTDDHQIYYYSRYSPSSEVYPKPYYYAALKWLYTDIQLETYFANLIKNNFVGNIILSVNSYMDQEKQHNFERSVKHCFTGSENAGSIMVMYNESKDNAPEIVEFNKGADDLKYQWLTDKVVEQISIGHSLPIQLLGILVSGKLGNSTELPVYEEIYHNTIVLPMKNDFDKGFKEIKKRII